MGLLFFAVLLTCAIGHEWLDESPWCSPTDSSITCDEASLKGQDSLVEVGSKTMALVRHQGDLGKALGADEIGKYKGTLPLPIWYAKPVPADTPVEELDAGAAKIYKGSVTAIDETHLTVEWEPTAPDLGARVSLKQIGLTSEDTIGLGFFAYKQGLAPHFVRNIRSKSFSFPADRLYMFKKSDDADVLTVNGVGKTFADWVAAVKSVAFKKVGREGERRIDPSSSRFITWASTKDGDDINGQGFHWLKAIAQKAIGDECVEDSYVIGANSVRCRGPLPRCSMGPQFSAGVHVDIANYQNWRQSFDGHWIFPNTEPGLETMKMKEYATQWITTNIWIPLEHYTNYPLAMVHHESSRNDPSRVWNLGTSPSYAQGFQWYSSPELDEGELYVFDGHFPTIHDAYRKAGVPTTELNKRFSMEARIRCKCKSAGCGMNWDLEHPFQLVGDKEFPDPKPSSEEAAKILETMQASKSSTQQQRDMINQQQANARAMRAQLGASLLLGKARKKKPRKKSTSPPASPPASTPSDTVVKEAIQEAVVPEAPIEKVITALENVREFEDGVVSGDEALAKKDADKYGGD